MSAARAVVVITGRGHEWEGRSEVAPAELAGQPFILSEGGSAMQEIVRRRLENAGVRLRVSMELGNICLVQFRGRQLSRVAGAFLEFLMQECRDNPQVAAGVAVLQ